MNHGLIACYVYARLGYETLEGVYGMLPVNLAATPRKMAMQKGIERFLLSLNLSSSTISDP